MSGEVNKLNEIAQKAVVLTEKPKEQKKEESAVSILSQDDKQPKEKAQKEGTSAASNPAKDGIWKDSGKTAFEFKQEQTLFNNQFNKTLFGMNTDNTDLLSKINTTFTAKTEENKKKKEEKNVFDSVPSVVIDKERYLKAQKGEFESPLDKLLKPKNPLQGIMKSPMEIFMEGLSTQEIKTEPAKAEPAKTAEVKNNDIPFEDRIITLDEVPYVYADREAYMKKHNEKVIAKRQAKEKANKEFLKDPFGINKYIKPLNLSDYFNTENITKTANSTTKITTSSSTVSDVLGQIAGSIMEYGYLDADNLNVSSTAKSIISRFENLINDTAHTYFEIKHDTIDAYKELKKSEVMVEEEQKKADLAKKEAEEAKKKCKEMEEEVKYILESQPENLKYSEMEVFKANQEKRYADAKKDYADDLLWDAKSKKRLAELSMKMVLRNVNYIMNKINIMAQAAQKLAKARG